MARRLTDRRSFLLRSAQLMSAWALGCEGNGETSADTSRIEDSGAGTRAGGSDSADITTGDIEAGPAAKTDDASATPPSHDGSAPGDGAAVGCELTRADIEGPYFTPDSPERGDLREADMPGVQLRLHGRVLDADCQPVKNAVVDLWQADDSGAYDTVGFRLRGHVRVDDAGRYEFLTIVPGHYLNGAQYRPAHLHVKVYVGQSEMLTTQLYFEGDPYNDIDPWFSEETMLRPIESGGEQVAELDFAV